MYRSKQKQTLLVFESDQKSRYDSAVGTKVYARKIDRKRVKNEMPTRISGRFFNARVNFCYFHKLYRYRRASMIRMFFIYIAKRTL